MRTPASRARRARARDCGPPGAISRAWSAPGSSSSCARRRARRRGSTLCSLAALARQEGYCCPTFLDDADESDESGDENAAKTAAFLDIREGRHPVLDATLAGGERVVPNSVTLGCFPGNADLKGVSDETNGIGAVTASTNGSENRARWW